MWNIKSSFTCVRYNEILGNEILSYLYNLIKEPAPCCWSWVGQEGGVGGDKGQPSHTS